MLSLFITDDGNADNTLSMPQSSIGNLLMPADLLQKAAILPAKTRGVLDWDHSYSGIIIPSARLVW